MIDGLYIEMTSGKLAAMLNAKKDHHGRKASWYKDQADRLSSEIDTTGDVGKMSNNPTQSLRQSQQSHENKRDFFAVLADNIIPNETYRLSETNCIRLELYSQY